MRPLLRVRSDLLQRVHADLSRPHPHAWERVGFLFCRSGHTNSSCLALAFDYEPVDDHDYVVDDGVGANIEGRAIRKAMQRALDTGDGVFHVHRHEHHGEPWFSAVDLDGLSSVLPSFAAVSPHTVHGGIVLSADDASTISWFDDALVPGALSVVGYPSQMRRGRDGF